jgi:acyl-coenzyme A synthetase/AMP-(fatty) acid ligase
MGSPLVRVDDLEAPLARCDGRVLSRRQYLADVEQLARLLPPRGPMLNVAADRYRFAVGLGAAMQRGHVNLLPPNHTPDMVARLRESYPSTYCLVDEHAPSVDLPTVRHPPLCVDLSLAGDIANIEADTVTAQVLTSGSTGTPVAHTKRWGLLVRSAESEARRLAKHLVRADLVGVSVVATVPAQHMYGFESSVLIGLIAGAILDADRPFYPADIVRALARTPRPRLLVTTPFHLKMLLDAGIDLPPIDLTLCATAPLSPQLAGLAEVALSAPLVEIYGCTEAGQVATRRTTAGPTWHTLTDLRLTGDGEQTVVSGGHVPEPTLLADVLEVIDETTFRLLGRSNDLINVAGKRSSLSHLNFHLNTIDGVHDGAFWLPPDDAVAAGVVRLVAFVVAPSVSREQILAALRLRVDAAFLPRRIVSVEALPRDATGKLSAARLTALAEESLGWGTTRASH